MIQQIVAEPNESQRNPRERDPTRTAVFHQAIKAVSSTHSNARTHGHARGHARAVMSRQLARLGGGVGASPAAPASIDAVSIKVGETFIDSQALRTRVERLMLAQGRQCRLDKRMSGGPGKLLRCSGAIIVDGVKGATGCSVLVRAYNKRTTKEWRVTEAILDHAQCTGQSGDKKKRPCRRSVEEEAAKLINANHKISSPALVKTLKATAGVEILERTANRVRSDVLRKGKDAIASQYQLLDSYLSIIGRDNGNIVECEVSTTCTLAVETYYSNTVAAVVAVEMFVLQELPVHRGHRCIIS